MRGVAIKIQDARGSTKNELSLPKHTHYASQWKMWLQALPMVSRTEFFLHKLVASYPKDVDMIPRPVTLLLKIHLLRRSKFRKRFMGFLADVSNESELKTTVLAPLPVLLSRVLLVRLLPLRMAVRLMNVLESVGLRNIDKLVHELPICLLLTKAICRLLFKRKNTLRYLSLHERRQTCNLEVGTSVA